MCSGSEAGSYSRLIAFVYHSTLGSRVIKKKCNGSFCGSCGKSVERDSCMLPTWLEIVLWRERWDHPVQTVLADIPQVASRLIRPTVACRALGPASYALLQGLRT